MKELLAEFDFANFNSVRWPLLNTLYVPIYYGEIDDFVAFLKSHPNLKKLHVRWDIFDDEDDQVVKTIAAHLPNLVDLNIGSYEPKNLSFICGLIDLESLVIKTGSDVEPFKYLKKLKYLE